MFTHLFDIVKIVIFTMLFSFLISRLPNLTFEGGLVVCASVYLIISGWVYRGLGKDQKSLKFITSKKKDLAFDEKKPSVSQRDFQIAGIKLVIASLSLYGLSVVVFYLSS